MLTRAKDRLSAWADASPLGRRVFTCARNALVRLLSPIPDERYAAWLYRLYTGQTLHLDPPVTANEKLWYLKLHNRDPLLQICSDKVRVRGYVARCGYPDILIPELGIFDDPRELNFATFAEPVLLKTNNGSGGHILYDPADRSFNERAARAALRRELRTPYYLISREWNYRGIPPKILAERVLRDVAGNPPDDYKFMCFEGEPRFLFLDRGILDEAGRHRHTYPRNIYDMDYHRLPFRWGRDGTPDNPPPPENFPRMVQIARTLAAPFPHSRVDLYNIGGKIYFGEITFYHGGCCQMIDPPEWDEKIAAMINIHSEKIVRGGGLLVDPLPARPAPRGIVVPLYCPEFFGEAPACAALPDGLCTARAEEFCRLAARAPAPERAPISPAKGETARVLRFAPLRGEGRRCA